MDAKVTIAKRVALELRDGELVNLGIGLPTMVAQFLPRGLKVYLQTENGLVGMGAAPAPGMGSPSNVDAGGRFAGAIPGAASIDSCVSFGLIRGGHLDLTVLGGLEVDEQGQLANWMIPGKMVPGMGGGMDLVTGAKRVIVAMSHSAKGAAKIVKKCSLPITSIRRVNLIVTRGRRY
jgi:acetate CoA/acetoacetate CoA-transferase beta subunit